MKKAWLICGGGGFSWETRELGKSLEKYFDVYFLFANESYEGRNELPLDKTVFVPTLTARYNPSKIRMIINFIKLLFIGLKVFKKSDALVICVGTSIGIPLLIAARFFAIKTLFLESMTRISSLSKTGELLRKYKISTKTLVQWPEQENTAQNIFFWGNII